MNRVVVQVYGGVAEVIEKPVGVVVEVRDYDNAKGIEIDPEDVKHGLYAQDDHGEWYQMDLHESSEELLP